MSKPISGATTPTTTTPTPQEKSPPATAAEESLAEAAEAQPRWRRGVAVDDATCRAAAGQRLYEMLQSGEEIPQVGREAMEECGNELNCTVEEICRQRQSHNLEVQREAFNPGIVDDETQEAHEENVAEVYEQRPDLHEFSTEEIQDPAVKKQIQDFHDKHLDRWEYLKREYLGW